MKRLLLGVLLASLAVYVWGFLFWGASTLPYSAWERTADDAAAAQVLREHFPREGTYHVPGMHHDAETLGRLFEAGPVAFVHITSADGRPQVDMSIMAFGFGLNVLVILALAVLMWKCRSALPTYGARVAFAAMVGLVVVLLVDAGDVVWWQIDWRWKAWLAVYHVGALLVAGLVLGAFVPGSAVADSASEP